MNLKIKIAALNEEIALIDNKFHLYFLGEEKTPPTKANGMPEYIIKAFLIEPKTQEKKKKKT